MKAPRFLKSLWKEWIRPSLVMAAIIFPIKSSLADINFVPTGSMKPTILEGDVVFVNKLAYDLKVPFTTRHLAGWGDPARGDVVVLFSPEDGMRLVKRVVGAPGDTLELRNNTLFVNGARADYAPLGRSALVDVAEGDRERGVFATETVDGRSHAVMAQPRVSGARRWFGPVTLGPDEYFVMGDNRDDSKDSRYFGVVPRSRIVGRAEGVFVSLDKPGDWLPRFDRFLSGLR